MRAGCTRAKHTGRRLRLPPQDQYEALQAAQTWSASAEGQQRYQQRAGVEGTLSHIITGEELVQNHHLKTMPGRLADVAVHRRLIAKKGAKQGVGQF